MTISTITSKGQTTIPKEIRELLGLEAQTQVAYEAKDGYVILRPVNSSLDDFAGILKSDKPMASKNEERKTAGRMLGRQIGA